MNVDGSVRESDEGRGEGVVEWCDADAHGIIKKSPVAHNQRILDYSRKNVGRGGSKSILHQ